MGSPCINNKKDNPHDFADKPNAKVNKNIYEQGQTRIDEILKTFLPYVHCTRQSVFNEKNIYVTIQVIYMVYLYGNYCGNEDNVKHGSLDHMLR